MAKNHSKTITIGLQYRARGTITNMTQPFFPGTISAQSRNNEFLTIKTVVRKTHQNNGHTGSSCLDKAVLAQSGGEGMRRTALGNTVSRSSHAFTRPHVPVCVDCALHLHICKFRGVSRNLSKGSRW